MEIGKNNRIEQTPIHDLNLPANPHDYWLFGGVDFQSGNMISSRSRYDHFDTAPYINFIFVSRFLERHSGENRFSPLSRQTPKPLILLDFLPLSFLCGRMISSQGRYNHFDTAPYINFDFLPSIFGETFGREVLLSAPSINPGSIDFTGFFACKLLHEGDDFEFHANKPNSKWVTGISYIHTKQGVLYLSISTTTASLPTRPEHSRR